MLVKSIGSLNFIIEHNQDGQSVPNDGMDGADDQDDEPQAAKKVRQKKKTTKKSHLVENLDTITSKLKDEYQDVRTIINSFKV